MQTSPASSSTTAAPASTAVQFLACAPADIDATTGACAHPVWVAQPTLIPPLDAASGTAIAVAILACWAVAVAFRSTRQAGD